MGPCQRLNPFFRPSLANAGAAHVKKTGLLVLPISFNPSTVELASSAPGLGSRSSSREIIYDIFTFYVKIQIRGSFSSSSPFSRGVAIPYGFVLERLLSSGRV